MSSTIPSADLFFCYAHEDEQWRKKLAKHLSPLLRLGFITGWHDRQILPGTDWAHEIDARLSTSKIILLLVSADFIASDYCYGHEMSRALAKHEEGEASVIPVIIRPVIWENTPFGKLQALPTNAKPISTWARKDEAFVDVARSIEKMVKGRAAPTDASLAMPPSPFRASGKLERAIIQQVPPSQAGILPPQSASKEENVDNWKYMLQHIQKQLSEIELRNMYKDTIRTLKKDLEEIYQKIRGREDKQSIEHPLRSVEVICSALQMAIWECDVILILFAKLLVLLDRLRTKHADVSEMASGVDEFYRSLEKCQNCLDEAFQHILL